MTRLSPLFYVVILGAAFLIGLTLTLGVSRALWSATAGAKPGLEEPVRLNPAPEPARPPTVEC